uniref:Uncharacterized protein n=1 Tax=Glossina austeni TaxID=7395 RepID=A0A1A9VA15_GLOAU
MNIVDNDQHSFVYSLDVELTPRGEVLMPLAIVAIYRFSHPTLRAFSVRVNAPRSQERPPQVPQPAPPQMLSQGSPLRSQTSLFNSGIMAKVAIARNAILLQSVAEISITAQLAMITSSVVQTFYTIPHTTIAVAGIINIDIVAAVTFLARSSWLFGVTKPSGFSGSKFQKPSLQVSQRLPRTFVLQWQEPASMPLSGSFTESQIPSSKEPIGSQSHGLQTDKGEAAANGYATIKQFNHYVVFLRSSYIYKKEDQIGSIEECSTKNFKSSGHCQVNGNINMSSHFSNKSEDDLMQAKQ